jgi:hypothetical protein
MKLGIVIQSELCYTLGERPTQTGGVLFSNAVTQTPNTLVVTGPYVGPYPKCRLLSLVAPMIARVRFSTGAFCLPRKDMGQVNKKEQDHAMTLVRVAVNSGQLVRPDYCETCGQKPKDNKTRAIVAHHWMGYGQPLNVIWVCRSCNGYLDKHDGSQTKEDARIEVTIKHWGKLGYVITEEEARAKVALRTYPLD